LIIYYFFGAKTGGSEQDGAVENGKSGSATSSGSPMNIHTVISSANNNGKNYT
jgi:hypothetical protein